MPDKYRRFLMRTNRWAVVGRSPSAEARFLMFACLLVPNYVAAQSMRTEPVNVLDANSATVATLFVPRSSIQISEIAVLVNDNDPQSVEVASYYQQVRKIPSRNMIHLNFDQNKIHPGLPSNNGIDPAEFATLKAQVDAAAGPEIQAFVVSWSRPFRIARFNYYPTNYSITSAFAFGIDAAYLTSNNCAATPLNRYYGSASTAPFTDFGIRPTMMLAGVSTTSVKATIDKGLKADRNLPGGNGWFVRTADSVRSGPRLQDFQKSVQDLESSRGTRHDVFRSFDRTVDDRRSKTPPIFFFTRRAWLTSRG